MLDATQILKRPIITEKTTWEAGSRNRYAFEIHKDATKPQVAASVAKLYGVRVLSVATMNRKGEVKKNRYGATTTPTVKRAIVQLHEEDSIDLY